MCPFCEVMSHFTVRWGRVPANSRQVRFAATCDNCEMPSSGKGLATAAVHPYTTEDVTLVRKSIGLSAESLEWWPKIGQAPEVPDVPESIARAAKEAHSSASVGNHMAAILMARTVVEATAKNQGITSGQLVKKIDAMKDANLIRPAIAEQAHEVRFAGNDMAHGDIDIAPESADSEEILALMDQVLSEVFQGPALMQRLRAKRTSTQGEI